MSNESRDQRFVLSRGEIENACLLSAIPQDGCAWSELPARLGLSPLLEESVAEAVGPLVNGGWVQESDGRITVSVAGREWLKERLDALA